MADIIGDTECPQCRENGKDKTGNHLILFSNGSSFCNRCGYKEVANTFTKPTTTLSGEKTPEEIARELTWVKDNSKNLGLPDRKLNAASLAKYGVRVGLSMEDGRTPVCYYLPIYELSDNGVTYNLIGYKVKTFDKQMWIKGKGKNAAFFGADIVPRKGKRLFITEGQEDAISLYQALCEFGKPEYKSRIAVVSLQNGAGSADKEILRNKALIDSYKEVVLCFDMDAAGKEAVNRAMSVLPKEKVLVAKYQEKDANDMLKAGLAKELYFNVIQPDKPKPEKIISGDDVSLEDLLVPLNTGIETPFSGINAKLHGLRYGPGAGELTVVCAGSGMGKTTLAREFAYDLNSRHHLRLGNIFLEEQHKKTIHSYIAIDNNVPLAALRENPNMIPREDFNKSRSRLVANGRTFFMTHMGSIDSKELVDHMYYLSKVEHCDFIFLDHISLVVSGNDASEQGERKDLDILMTRLAAFCEDSGTSVIAIVHLKRPQNGSFNDGMHISLSHLRGSAGIEQLSWNIIAVEGDQHGTDPNRRIVRILKNREWGDIGVADDLEYNPDTGRLLSYSPGLTG